VRTKLEGSKIIVDAVLRGQAAEQAGLDVRDEIVAVAGRRVPEGRLELPLIGLHPGDKVPVVVARDGWLLTFDVVLDAPALPDAKIVPLPGAPPSARKLYQEWMGESFPE